MLVVPVALQPVLGSVLLDKVVDAVPEVVGLQQQQLDDEVANLGFVVLVAAHRLEVREVRVSEPCGGNSLDQTGVGSVSQEQVTAVQLRPHLVVLHNVLKLMGRNRKSDVHLSLEPELLAETMQTRLIV